MATSIYFNSRVTSIPGSYSEVDASGLASVGLGASGIVALIGEAEGGQPAIVQNVSNPGKIGKIFRSGDLLEGGTMLFDPSKDPDIPGGAQEVKFVKVNPATQSTLVLSEAGGSDTAITFTSRDYGAFTEKISVDISDGTDAGTRAIQIAFDSVTEKFDNIGSEGVATIQRATGFGTATATYAHASGITAAVSGSSAGLSTDFDGGYALGNGLDSEIAQTGVTETLTLTTSDAGDNAKTLTIYGIVGGVPDSETLTMAQGSPPTGAKLFSEVHAAVTSVQTLTGVMQLAGSGSGTNVFTGVNASRGVALNASGDVVEAVVASAGTTVKLTSSNASSVAEFLVLGTNTADANVAEKATMASGTITTTTAFKTVSYIFSGKAPAADSAAATGLWQNRGPAVMVSTSASDTTQTMSLYGLDASGAVQSETVALNGTTPVQSTGSWTRIDGAILSEAAVGTVSLFGGTTPGSQTKLTSLTAGQLTKGMTAIVSTDMDGATMSVSISSGTARGVKVGVDVGGSAVMELYETAGTQAGTQAFGSVSYIANLFQSSSDSATLSYTPFTLAPASYDTLDDWENYFATKDLWSLVKVYTGTSSGYALTNLDPFAAQACTASAYTMGDILNDMVTVVNAGSAYVTAAMGASADAPPANTPTPVFLTGGVEGSTLFSHWQAALDALRDYRVNTIVVLTTDAAVHAAVISHCAYMCAAGRSERDCVLGAPSATSMPDAKTYAMAMNTRHARLLIQDASRYNTLGTKEQFAPPFTACLAAGMQAGSDVGTSLTFKYMNLLETFGKDSSYTIQDDANELIQSGLCMIEKVPNVGYRWLRNVTTYLIDNNLAYCEASVNEAVNYSVYNFRTSMEAIVGKKGFAGTVTAAQGIAISILGQLVGVTAITSWRNLTITLTDDVMTIDVEIAPVIPVNFIKTTIHLVSSSFEATT